MVNSNLSRVIDIRLSALSYALREPMTEIADLCGETFDQPARLNQVLEGGIQRLDSCALIYVVNPFGIQMSGNVTRGDSDGDFFGQDLSDRNWFRLARGHKQQIFLSDVYISRPENVIGITAVHRIVARSGTLLGYLCADFQLHNLPLVSPDVPQMNHWKKIAGDPSIRDLMFHQERSVSDMERRFDDLKVIVMDLVARRGIFHFKLHFSTSRATLWTAADPMRYQVHVLDEILQPSICLAYDACPPPAESRVDPATVERVLDLFQQLRTSDRYLYLRAGSLNTVNGLVGLNLSWDSQHYLDVEEFLATDTAHWIGADNVWFGDDVNGVRVL